MKMKEFYYKYENGILSLFLLLVIGIFVAIRYDCYYALNDDVLMKDIVSGVYAGIPDARNLHMRYPLGLLLSLLYRFANTIPWYGLLMAGCNWGSVYLIVKRSLLSCQKTWTKCVLLAAEGFLIVGFLLEHLVFLQFTVTSGLLATAAVVLFITIEDTEHLVRKSIPCIVLAILSYWMRSTMLLMMLAFIVMAGIFKWGMEDKFFTKKNFQKYFTVFGCIMAGVILTQGIHEIAYAGKEWDTFLKMNDARVTLYDYSGVPAYEGYETLYEQSGISRAQQRLIQSYNYALDDQIDENKMYTLEQAIRGLWVSLFERIRAGIIRYRYIVLHMEGYPYSIGVVFGYILVWLASDKKRRTALELLGLAVIRSVVWTYILFGNRYPERITHSLYLAEFLLLMSVYIMRCKKGEEIRFCKQKKWLGYVGCTLLGILMSFYSLKAVNQQFDKENGYHLRKELIHYCKEHPDNFYFLDTYSVINLHEKVFEEEKATPNWETLGGWICKSPLYDKKLEAYDIKAVDEALKVKENVYLVQDVAAPFDWLIWHYEEKGYEVIPKEVVVLSEKLGVYQLEFHKR